MSLSSALYAGLSGMAANSEILSITGNNLANVGTTAYKSTQADFQTQISQSLSEGTAPTSTTGGTNPQQIGLGTELADIETDFSPGSLQSTGVSSDLALSGNGFFIVNSDGSQLYTRAGNFSLNSDNDLVTSTGATVQGYSVNSDFQLIPGQLGDLNIPVGSLTIAQATQNVTVNGNLNASGVVASTRSNTTSQELYSDDTATTAATGTTLLTGLYNSSGTALFAAGDTITISGATQGSTTLPTTTLTVGSGTTYQDLANFINSSMGINTSITGDPAGTTITNGQLSITPNDGTVNDITLNTSDLSVSNGTTVTDPLTFTTTGTNNGESVTTNTTAYDSLGDPINVNVTFVLESAGTTGTTWRYYAESTGNPDADPALGTGTVSFNTNGQLIPSSSATTFTLQGENGAAPDQTVTLQFSGTNGVGGLSSLGDTTSQVTATADGSSVGTLDSYSVGANGLITGTFSNSETRTLGQIALANFINPEGLSSVGGNDYQSTASSGAAAIVTAGTGGTGSIVGGSLEESNVDLSTQFVQLIAATTGYSASSRVITTGDTMIQQLLQMVS